MTLIDAILIRRADEQMSAAWHTPTLRESREERVPAGLRLCRVPGCSREIVGRRAFATICAECKAAGMTALPCRGCGGPMRDLDRRHGNKRRGRHSRGYCQTCRAGMAALEAA